MSKIMELRNKRTTLWEQTKAFLEEHRDENGLVAKEAVEQYERMAADVRALGAEIERLENQAAFEAELKRPTSKNITNKIIIKIIRTILFAILSQSLFYYNI